MNPHGSKLYHKNVFWPKGKFSALQGRTLHLSYGPHALQASETDRYGAVQLPKSIVFDEHSAIEMECAGRFVKKVVVRQAYDNTHDLILVVFLNNAEYFVGTCWLNQRDDKHVTLNHGRYDRS